MNLVFHAIAGGAIAHGITALSERPGREKAKKVSFLSLAAACCAAIGSHGLLDCLKHSYPVPSVPDIAVALLMSVAWVAAVHARLRVLFALTLAASFAPDVVDHLPRTLNQVSHTQLLPVPKQPVFPWHTLRWSGSMYPSARIHPGSGLIALEDGQNREISLMNHLLVLAASGTATFLGKGAFRWTKSDSPR